MSKKGSEKLLEAWKHRALTENSVKEIMAVLDDSPAVVEEAIVVGGASPTGVQLTLSYSDDDVPRCGNDILFWLKWHRANGGTVRPPKILINGIPFPDFVRVQLNFGVVSESVHAIENSQIKEGFQGI